MHYYKIFSITILCFIQTAFAQTKYSSQRPYLSNVYEVFDYVHHSMYSDDAKQSEAKLTKILGNNMFIDNTRKVLNEKGKELLRQLKNIKSAAQRYDFQYCWLPIEKEQTDSTYAWYNKNQTGSSKLFAQFENGTMRIKEINIDYYIGETEKKKFYTMSCSQTTIGPVVRGKRIGLSEQKFNQPVLAYNEESGFWKEANYTGKTKEGLYELENYFKLKSVAASIVPIDIQQGDIAYYYKQNEYKRVHIAKIEGSRINIVGDKIDISVNRRDLYFKINTYETIDTESKLF